MNIPSPKELLNAGIAPTLVNYLNFVGHGSCEKDCPIHELCVKTREKIDSMGAYPDTIGLCYKWSCPLYIYDVDKARDSP